MPDSTVYCFYSIQDFFTNAALTTQPPLQLLSSPFCLYPSFFTAGVVNSAYHLSSSLSSTSTGQVPAPGPPYHLSSPLTSNSSTAGREVSSDLFLFPQESQGNELLHVMQLVIIICDSNSFFKSCHLLLIHCI